MNIAFDIDGVVLNSIIKILEYINMKTDENIKPKDIKEWNLDVLGVSEKTISDAVKYMWKQPKISSYPFATKTLNQIYKQDKKPLIFITGRKDLDSAYKQLGQLNWNPIIPEMIIDGGNRNKLDYLMKYNINILIEDDDKYIEEYNRNGIKVGLIRRPWNIGSKADFLFNNWMDFYYWFKEFNEKKRDI